jgi:hypothetical protein
MTARRNLKDELMRVGGDGCGAALDNGAKRKTGEGKKDRLDGADDAGSEGAPRVDALWCVAVGASGSVVMAARPATDVPVADAIA